jgi:hypothetical protein
VQSALDELFRQLPQIEVKRVRLAPESPRPGQDVVARVELAGDHQMLLEIGGDGRLCSVRTVLGPL